MLEITRPIRTAIAIAPPDGGARSRPARGGLSLHGKIDACRGLFALFVVVAHAWEATWSIYPTGPSALPEPVRSLMARSVGTGIFWVMGFFVLSGYCIHLSVSRLLGSGRFPMRVYLVARLSRILPLYYLALVAAVAAEGVVGGERPSCWQHGRDLYGLLSQVFLVQNLTETYGSFAPSWSITNEVFYYLLYGLLAPLAVTRRDRPARVGMVLCVVIAATMEGFYAAWGREARAVLSLGMLFGLGANWFLGVFVALHRGAATQSRWVGALARCWPILLATAIGSWSAALLPLGAVFLLCGLAFALMLLRFHAEEDGSTATANATATAGWLESGARFLGLSSYPMYLFHGPAILIVGSALLRYAPGLDWRVAWAVLVATGLLAGLVLGVLLEAPIMAWRGELLRRMKAASPAG